MEQPGVTLINFRVQAGPADVVVRSHGLSIFVVGAEFLPVVLAHFRSESLVAGVVGVPAHDE